MATYCIICAKKKEGITVKDDRVLESIRWFKRNVTRNEQGNKLCVCKECYPVYKKRRDTYTSRQIIYVVIGAIFAILIFALSLSLAALATGAVILVGLYLLSLLSYTPDLAIKVAGGSVAAKAQGGARPLKNGK